LAISNTPVSVTQNGGYQFALPSGTPGMPNPGMPNVPNVSLPGMNLGGVNPATLKTSPNQVYQLLSQQPTSLTNTLAPLLQQVYGSQANLMQPLFQQQGAQQAGIAQSDAMKRGLTGSSIEMSGIQQAYTGANQGYAQYLSGQLDKLVPTFANAAQFDVGQQNQYYSNLAQAVGQQLASHIQQQQFAQMLQAGLSQAGMTSHAQEMAGIFQGLGSLGGGLFSDVRLKRDVRRFSSWKGLGLYFFRYERRPKVQDLPSGVRVGFLAHEVARKRPDCVVLDRGFLKVDYARLFGLKLRNFLAEATLA
jgi:hypothetical protein